MTDLPLDARERRALCDLLDGLGPGALTLLPGWTAADVAGHLVQRERDPLAGPCLVLPRPFQRFADRRRARMLAARTYASLVARLRSGPPPGVFRIGWVRAGPNLNEFFVHQEDVRRANGLGPREDLTPALEAGLWRNARGGGRFLSRRLRGAGLELAWAGTGERATVRRGAPVARLSGPPGELLLYVFGRRDAARVELSGPAAAVAAVRRARFGM